MDRISAYVAKWADLQPDYPAILCGERVVTYAELSRMIGEKRQEKACDYPSQTPEYLAWCLAQEPLVLHTTGTTGVPKSIVIPGTAQVADAENLVDAQGFTHDLTFITTGPMDHIGNLSKAWPTFLVGATLCILSGMKNPEDFFCAIEASENKVAAFLVPASIRMLLQLSSGRLAALADKIDFIETGAAPITQADMQSFAHLLPHSRLFNTYASTETGIISTYNFNDGNAYASCVGKVMRHSRVILVDEEGRPLENATAEHPGRIVCQGPTLMQGYLGDPVLTAEVLHDDAMWTNDLGYFSPEGNLFLSGRMGDVINVGGLKVSPVEVEEVTLSVEGIRDCICIGKPHPMMGQILKLLVVMDDGKTLDKRALAMALRAKLEPYKIPLQYEQVDHVERTFNGKLNRKYYNSK